MQLNTKSNLLMSHSMGDNCVYVWDISNSVVSSANSNSNSNLNSKEDEEVLMVVVDQTTQRLFKVCLGSYSSSTSLRIIIRGSMNSDLLTFGSSDCTVCVWDLYLNDGMEAKLLYKLYGHMGVVNCTEFISTLEEDLMTMVVVLSGGDDGLIYAGRLEQHSFN
jgi:WD40 repeat protein